MTIMEAGLIAAVPGLFAAGLCWCSLRKQLTRSEAVVRCSVEHQRTECAEQISEVKQVLADLELSAQNVERALAGNLTRTARSQAIQLLRSGASLETAAIRLGLARREMHLISRIANLLGG
jgi:hypothetical protein